MEDNQGAKYHPLPLPADDIFAYRTRRLSHGACLPEPGSAAADGPTAGSLLLFKFPLMSVENRPLELLIEATDPSTGRPQSKRVELDI